ncbi:ribonuclease H-like domain-containing protein [Tanacetum coccineum]
MDLEIAQTTTIAKLPILKQGKYDMWRLRIEQYFQVQDYALWDVIENGNSFQPAAKTTTNANGTPTTLIPGPELLMKRFKIRMIFGGNEATKKTQKTLLKQMYKNFSAPSTESLDSIFNRLQKIVKGTTSSSSSSNSQKLAFVSSTSSTNEVNTTYGVSTANTQVSTASTQVSTANLSDDTIYAFLASQPNGSQFVYEDLEQIYDDDLEDVDLKWQLALLSMRTRRFFQKTGRKITINRNDTAGYDKSKVECFNCHKMGYFARECKGSRNQDSKNKNQDNSRRTINMEETSSKAILSIDEAGFDWRYMTDDEVLTNMALMAFSDSEPKFEGYGPKTSKSVSKDTSNEVRESHDASLVEELVSNDKLEKKTVFSTVININFVRPQQQEKLVRKLVKYAEMYSFDHVQANCNYHQREKMESGNNYTKVNYNYSDKKAHPNAHRNIVPRVVLMKTGLRPLNTARPVNTAHPKTTVYSARPMSLEMSMLL